MKRIFFSLVMYSLTLMSPQPWLNAQSNYWEWVGSPGVGSVRRLTVDSLGYIFGGSLGSGLYRSTDDGLHWALVYNWINSQDVWSLAVHPNGQIYEGSIGVHRSTDHGDTWKDLNTGYSITTLAIKISRDGFIFAGGYITGSGDGLGVLRSTDSGENWTLVNNGLGDNYVLTLAIDSSGNLFAGTLRGGVFRSTNNGDLWTECSTEIADTTVTELAVNFASDIFAGTLTHGIYRSTDSGDHWLSINEGLGNGRIDDFTFNSKGDIFVTLSGFTNIFYSKDDGNHWNTVDCSGIDPTAYVTALCVNSKGFLFAGTSERTAYGGFYRSTNSTTKLIELDNQVAGSFALHQNYPNPFNPITTIRFTVSTRGIATLKVYDVLGREVTTLFSKNIMPGTYESKWIPQEKASGVYYYELRMGTMTHRRRMILLH